MLALIFYALLLRHPWIIFIASSAWHRTYQYLFFHHNHSAWHFEAAWNLWLALTLPFFPIAVLPMMFVVGKTATADLGGFGKTHAMNTCVLS